MSSKITKTILISTLLLSVAGYYIAISPAISPEPKNVKEAAQFVASGRLYKAIPYLKKQAESNDAEAKYILGTLSYGGFLLIDGVIWDIDGNDDHEIGYDYKWDGMATHFRATDKSSPISRCSFCSFIPRDETYIELSREDGIDLLESAYKLGHSGAAGVLGEAYGRGVRGAPRQDEISKTYYEYAISKGDHFAALYYGQDLLIKAEVCYSQKIPMPICPEGIENTFRRAASLLEIAAQSRDDDVRGTAIDHLLELYSGHKGPPEDKPKLAKWQSIFNRDMRAQGSRASRIQIEGEATQAINARREEEDRVGTEMRKYDDFCARHRSLQVCW